MRNRHGCMSEKWESANEKHWQAEAVISEAWNVNAEEFVCCCPSQIMSLLCLTKEVINCLFCSGWGSNYFPGLLKIKLNHD